MPPASLTRWLVAARFVGWLSIAGALVLWFGSQWLASRVDVWMMAHWRWVAASVVTGLVVLASGWRSARTGAGARVAVYTMACGAFLVAWAPVLWGTIHWAEGKAQEVAFALAVAAFALAALPRAGPRSPSPGAA